MSDYTLDKDKLAAALAAAEEARKLMASAFGCLEQRAAHVLDGTGIRVLVEESLIQTFRGDYDRLARVVTPKVYVDELQLDTLDAKLDEMFSGFRKYLLSLSPRNPEELVCCAPLIFVKKDAYLFEFFLYTVVDIGGVKVDAMRDKGGNLVLGGKS